MTIDYEYIASLSLPEDYIIGPKLDFLKWHLETHGFLFSYSAEKPSILACSIEKSCAMFGVPRETIIDLMKNGILKQVSFGEDVLVSWTSAIAYLKPIAMRLGTEGEQSWAALNSLRMR